VLGYLRGRLRPGDLCLTLGAGDITTLADDLLGSWADDPAAGPRRPEDRPVEDASAGGAP
jgi:hypothetical protein